VQHLLNNQFGLAVDVNRGFGMLFINKVRNGLPKMAAVEEKTSF
jgi:hypothetical protein